MSIIEEQEDIMYIKLDDLLEVVKFHSRIKHDAGEIAFRINEYIRKNYRSMKGSLLVALEGGVNVLDISFGERGFDYFDLILSTNNPDLRPNVILHMYSLIHPVYQSILDFSAEECVETIIKRIVVSKLVEFMDSENEYLPINIKDNISYTGLCETIALSHDITR